MADDDEFREGSIASRIFDARRTPEAEARRARQRLADPPTPAPESPTERVMKRSRSSRASVAAALICAVILHGGLLVVAAYSLESSSNRDQKRDSSEAMQIRHVVQMDRPEPTSEQPETPEEPPEPKETESSPPDEPSSEPDPQPAEEAEPSATNATSDSSKPAAKAGEVVDAKPESPQLADFTDAEVPSGGADSFAGGVTAPAGSGDRAVEGDEREVGGGTEADAEGEGGRAVGLDQRDWDCPWPEQAKHLSVDEQVVVLRAVVGPDGSPRSVSLVSDPGFGFGEAALECARDHNFEPALDADGEPQTATSPPIRVRFTR